jgi:hypothetical protein
MATFSPSWAPTRPVTSRVPSPSSPAQSPLSRSSSQSLRAGDPATIKAWENARDTYRKSLSEKDFNRILVPAGPEDILSEIATWQKRQSESRYAKITAGVRGGLDRLQRFSASIDILAQGTPSPGCLLWGFIKFVLTVGDAFCCNLSCEAYPEGPVKGQLLHALRLF